MINLTKMTSLVHQDISEDLERNNKYLIKNFPETLVEKSDRTRLKNSIYRLCICRI